MSFRLLTLALCLCATPTRALGQDPLSNVFKVPLKRQSVPVIHGGRQVAVKTAYYGDVALGGLAQQHFTVVFDTGSGHLFVPSVTCEDVACERKNQYDVGLSPTSIQINNDGFPPQTAKRDQVAIAYGTGQIRGPFVQETVCLGQAALPPQNIDVANGSVPLNCAKARVITARKLSDEPFIHFGFDGVLGLGLRALALHPEFHIFDQLAKAQGIATMFSFFMSKSDDVPSEITFGGHDAGRMESPLAYLPVHNPQQGYWRVQIQSVRIGSQPFAMCEDGACTAIVDTGTSLLGVPADGFNTLVMDTARKLTPELITSSLGASHQRASYIDGDGVDCRYVPGPPIIFDMGGFEVVLDAADYSRPVPTEVEGFDPAEPNVTHTVCRATMLPIDLPTIGSGVFVWGEPVLKKYYTSYDLDGERVGFSKAVHPASEIVSTEA